MNPPLKNIIFDLGNVLYSIDYNLTKQAFIDLGYTNFENMYSQFTADDLFEKLETGKISNEDFYEKLISVGDSNLTPTQIESAWNAMLLGWRLPSVNFLKSLSEKYPLYLLSNTNDIHLTEVNNQLKASTGMDSLDPLFIKAYYSHKVHLRKPNNDIFEFVAEDAQINPAETLFVDDSINNIENAAALGFKTKLLMDWEKIEELGYDRF